MSGSVNKVVLVGHLGRDPIIEQASEGKKMARFSIATSESFKDKNGERQTKTDWHNIVIYHSLFADISERYLRKGSKVFLEGSLHTRKWKDKSGQDKYTTEVVLSGYNCNLVMLDSEEKDNDSDGWDNTPNPVDTGDEIPW